MALGGGDAQGGEEEEGGEGERREEVSTPPPPAGGRTRTANAVRVGGWSRSGRRVWAARLTLYTSAGSAVVRDVNSPPTQERLSGIGPTTHEAAPFPNRPPTQGGCPRKRTGGSARSHEHKSESVPTPCR